MSQCPTQPRRPFSLSLPGPRAQPSTGNAPTRPPLSERDRKVRAIWTNAMAWTFQGWLAMFFAGAAVAKLTAPAAHLDILLGWSQWTSLDLVRGLGVVEAALALSMLVPILNRETGRHVMVVGASLLVALETVFLITHTIRLEANPAFVNAILLGLTVTVWFLRRRRTD